MSLAILRKIAVFVNELQSAPEVLQQYLFRAFTWKMNLYADTFEGDKNKLAEYIVSIIKLKSPVGHDKKWFGSLSEKLCSLDSDREKMLDTIL
jgi:hypothetical protein